jgi:hypothetical protein
LETHLLVEASIIERNITHFCQAEGTLFTRHDITQAFDYEGNLAEATDRIQGEYFITKIPNVTDSACTLFKTLSNQNNLNNFDNTIFLLEFKNAFKNGTKEHLPPIVAGIWDIINVYYVQIIATNFTIKIMLIRKQNIKGLLSYGNGKFL